MIAFAKPAATLAAAIFSLVAATTASAASVPTKDPLLGNKAAINAGEAIYARRCMVCHGQRGGRGPDIFGTTLSNSKFLATVMNGKSGSRGQMPAWSGTLTKKQVWEVEAFVKSRPHF